MTSTIKVNTITTESGSTLTVGGCGKTVALASGATQTGFGRSGSVDWVTTPKTSTFTAVSGEGYFINSGSSLTCNLPAGSAGDIVSFSDYARNFQTYNFIVSPNGSETIGGIAQDAILTVNGQAATFVYVDSTKGWVNVQNAEDTETGQSPYITACGGNTTITSGDYKTHIFTAPGTFTVTAAGSPAGSNGVEYLVVAGGGSGGAGCAGGGAGAGGMRLRTVCGSASPLNAPAPLQVPATAYSIEVGGGGTAVTSPSSGASSVIGTQGSSSIFSSITSAGGGAGAAGNPGSPDGNNGGTGGSGGGGGHNGGLLGSGNTPPVSPPQGNPGKASVPVNDDAGGAGGGAACAATLGSPTQAANGGAGSYIPTTFIGPTAPSYGETGPQGRFFAGGAGASVRTSPANPVKGVGGLGGGADGITGGSGTPASPNMGGGGSAGSLPGSSNTSGAGGSGIVMIRYKFQN